MRDKTAEKTSDGTPVWLGLASEEAVEAMQEFQQVVRLQQAIGWTGEAVPTHTLRSQALGPLTGLLDLGYVLLAKDATGKVIGFARVAATGHEKLHYLHEIGVLPSFQGKGLGKLLMQEIGRVSEQKQAEALLFTFNALNPRNAFFYLEKCGAYGIRLLPDFYGRPSGGRAYSFLARWDLGPGRKTSLSDPIPVLGEAAQFHGQDRFKVPVPGIPHDFLPFNHPLVAMLSDLLIELLAEESYQVIGFESGARSFWICSRQIT